MSAKLRSFIDYLKAPWRLWRRGRQLPARMQIAALVAGAVFVVAAVTVWTVARVRAQDEGGGGQTETVYDQVHRLRLEKSFDAARELALDFLSSHPERDVQRQQVQFEYAKCFYDERRFAESLPEFQSLVSDYAEVALDMADPVVLVDDAKFYLGVTQTIAKQYAAAHQTLTELHERWPQSNCAVKSVQQAIRVRIHEELDDWEPRDGAAGPSEIDNSETIETETAALASAYPDDPACAATLLDLLNYHIKRAWWNDEAAVQRKDNIVRVVGWMQQAAPEAVQTSRATVELAKVVFDEDPGRALALVDAARQKALAVGDASLRNDAEFAQACFLQALHQPAQAQAVWEGLLEREQDPEFAAHVRIFLAGTYASERRFEEALSVYEQVATDEHCSEAARATALVHKAQTLRSLGQQAEALSALDEVIGNYPQAASTGAARALHASWSKR